MTSSAVSKAIASHPSINGAPATPKRREYNDAAGNLRAFVTVLVVVHHAVLAYCSFLPKQPPASLAQQPRLWPAFPVIDTQRSALFDLIAGWNDTFFMALMFFISGLFVWSSLMRKPVAGFLQERALRLGVPFIAGALLLAPLAYFPSYLLTGAGADPAGFVRQLIQINFWPAGPAWFLWVLLAFDVALAAAFVFARGAMESVLAALAKWNTHPAAFAAKIAVLSALLYVPLALAVNPLRWSAFGPFSFQTSRILHYALYFTVGAAVGAGGWDNDLMAKASRLGRRWVLWVPAMLVVFVVYIAVAITAAGKPASMPFQVAANVLMSVTCATSSFGLMAVFARFGHRSSAMWRSLRDNAYGIFVLHYVFNSWTQMVLLNVAAPALVKGALAVAVTLGLSWGMTAMLRRIPAVSRVL